MSFWTHIVAVIDVDTYIIDKDVKIKVEQILKNAPKITGSEGSADVFVNIQNGYNYYTSADCKKCGYEATLKTHEDGGYSCDAPDGYRCPEGTYQTRVVITLIGDLRDRNLEQTKNEYKNFIDFIKTQCNFCIRNKAAKII